MQIEVPNLMDNETYAKAWHNLQQLNTRLAGIEGELNATVQRTVKAAPALAMVVGGEHLNALTDGADLIVSESRRNLSPAEIDALAGERKQIRHAIALQHRVLDRLRSQIGAELLEAARPQYQAIVARVLAALEELASAGAGERAFREAFVDADLPFASILRPMSLVDNLCTPGSEYALVNQYRREAIDNGLLPPSDHPATKPPATQWARTPTAVRRERLRAASAQPVLSLSQQEDSEWTAK